MSFWLWHGVVHSKVKLLLVFCHLAHSYVPCKGKDCIGQKLQVVDIGLETAMSCVRYCSRVEIETAV